MSKQSSVDWLLDRIEDVDLTPQIWEKIKQQAKAMHKAEVIDSRTTSPMTSGDVMLDREEAEQYYNETYGGNNEQQ